MHLDYTYPQYDSTYNIQRYQTPIYTQADEGKDSNRNGWMDADATGTGIAPRASRTRARVEIRRSDIDSLADI